MRIISGKYGSRRINVKIPDNVRPTADRVRESIFNILNNLVDFENLRVLDLFAGTGAFGFESLSRGCKFTQFVENNKRTTEIIRSVAKSLQIPQTDYNITNFDAIKYLQKVDSNQSYDLVFADPPYDDDVYNQLLENIKSSEILKPDGIAVIEYRTLNNLIVPDFYNIISERTFGDTSFKFIELKKSIAT